MKKGSLQVVFSSLKTENYEYLQLLINKQKKSAFSVFVDKVVNRSEIYQGFFWQVL